MHSSVKTSALVVPLTLCWILVSSCTGDDPAAGAGTGMGSPDGGASSTDGGDLVADGGDSGGGNDASSGCANGIRSMTAGPAPAAFPLSSF